MVSGDNENIGCYCEGYTMTLNDKLQFVVRSVDDVRSEPLFIKDAAIREGHGFVEFFPEDTKNLLGTYYYDLTITFANGEIKTPIRNRKFVII